MISPKRLVALALSFSLLPAAFGADARRAKFAKLAEAGNGVVKLTSTGFEEITAYDRDWSVVIQLTALGSEFKCAPCQCVDIYVQLY